MEKYLQKLGGFKISPRLGKRAETEHTPTSYQGEMRRQEIFVHAAQHNKKL